MKVLTITGRLGRDPELRAVGSGDSVLNASVAVDDRVKGDDGEWRNETIWVAVSVFGKRAESLQRVLYKGQLVCASGDFRLRTYTTREGAERTQVELRATELQPLEFPKREGADDPRPRQDRAREQHRDDFKSRRPAASSSMPSGYGVDESDDIPF